MESRMDSVMYVIMTETTMPAVEATQDNFNRSK